MNTFEQKQIDDKLKDLEEATSLDSIEIAQTWNTGHEELLASIADRCLGLSWMHTKCKRWFENMNFWLTIPSIIIGTISGSATIGLSSLFSGSTKAAEVTLGVLTLSCGVFSAINNFMKCSVLSESHRITAKYYSKLHRTIQAEIALRRDQRVQAKDFLLFHLTGEFASDNWSSKGLIHATTLKPTKAWDSLGLPNELIPRIGKPWDVAGETSIDNKFLPPGIPVSIGLSDALAGMLALEVFSKPTAFVISGSSDIAGISCAKLSEGKHNLSTVPKSCAPMPVIFGPTQSSGSAISWAAELFNSTPEELLSKSLESRETHDEIFLPFLAGERAPIWRSDIRALFAGLSHQSKFSDIAHAVIFGVGFTARHIIDQAKSLSKELPSVVHLGGASHQSKLWLDVRSRILRSEVVSFSESDSSSIGAAILAASAATGISPEVLAPKFSGEKLHFTSTIEDQNMADTEYQKYLDWVERSIH